MADVLVWFRSTDGELLTGQTGAGGRCEFLQATARTFDLLAYHRERRAGVRLNRLGFDPHVGVVERLVLQPMNSGALRVEVTDQAGKPVSDFALRVRLWGRSIRLARSDELLDDCLTGLPETEVAIQIERPYSRDPALYEPPKQVERRIVTPDSRATPTLKFRIRLMSRLCFDVAAKGALPHLLVRMRRSSNTEEEPGRRWTSNSTRTRARRTPTRCDHPGDGSRSRSNPATAK